MLIEINLLFNLSRNASQFLEVQQLNRQKLLAALEGKLPTLDDGLNVEPVYCQELLFSNGINPVSHMKIEGLGTIRVPISSNVSKS